MPAFNYTLASLVCVVLLLFRLIFWRSRKSVLATMPGPPPGSWLVGNIPQVLRPENVGDADFAWTKTYGTSLRIKGFFGGDMLFTTDPKSFQYILATSCYSFPKLPQYRFLIGLFTGRGLVWAEGAQHSRHKKAMDPAFSSSSVKRHLPLFRQTIQRTVGKWKDIVIEGGSVSTRMDVTPWMDRTAMEMLASTAFDYHLGTIEEKDNELFNASTGLFVNSFLERTDYTFALEALCGVLPNWFLSVVFSLVTDEKLAKVQKYMDLARNLARTLVDQRVASYNRGEESGHDVLSLLVQANLSAAPENKLSEEEVLAQLTTLILAGHETTASTISWVLYELSRNKSYQDELRQEVKEARARASMRGDAELTVADLEGMKLLGAALKETLRYHPILPQMMRIADRDDMIPLSEPCRTKDGNMISQIPIKKGQGLVLSIAAINRLPSLWGDDAHLWRPERFLEENESKPKTGLGVFANIVSFSAGVRSCIGWRFAMLEMQVTVTELLENFEFGPPPAGVQVVRAATTTMSPMVKGSKMDHAELPLTITPLI